MYEQSYFSLKDLASKMGVHWATVRRNTIKGSIKSVRVGGRIMIPKYEFDRLTENIIAYRDSNSDTQPVRTRFFRENK